MGFCSREVEDRKLVLDEEWEVLVWAVGDVFIFDLSSVQACASKSPLELKKKHYGGLGLRGSGEWEGKGEACRFLTREGKTRSDGHGTRARWCDVWGRLEGKATGIVVHCHPENFRFPQPMRIHPSEPFFNFAPSQGGDWSIDPGTPYVARYRFVVYDGLPDPDDLDRLWNDYAYPPVVYVGEN